MAVTIAPGFTGTLYPLNTPRIGWRSIVGTVSASTSAAGFAAANAATNRTDSFWRPTALPATWQIDAGADVSVSYVGIGAHDLGSRACTVLVQTSPDSVTWTTRLTIVPTDDSAIFGLFGQVFPRYVRLNISGAGGNPTIGVVKFGVVTEFSRPAIYAPSISFQRTRNVSYSANITEGGQWAGRSIVRTTLAPEMTVNHLSESWIASEWDEFALYAETAPFFVADRPGSYPASCAYAWTTSDLRAQRDVANANSANSVAMSLTGFLA